MRLERGVVEMEIDEVADAAFLAAQQTDEAKSHPRASVRSDGRAVDGDRKDRGRRLKFQRDRRAKRKAAAGPEKAASDREVRDHSVIGLLSLRGSFRTKPSWAIQTDSFVVSSLTHAVLAEPDAEAVAA